MDYPTDYPPEVIAEFEAAIQRLIALGLIEAKDDGYIFPSSLPASPLQHPGESPHRAHHSGDSIDRSSPLPKRIFLKPLHNYSGENLP